MTARNPELVADTGGAGSPNESHARFDGVDPVQLVGDTLLLLAVPLAMVAVFTLPTEVKRAYAFSYTEPTVLTAFTAHYVHLTPEHLAGNVLGFLLLASIAYGLSLMVGRRRLFFVSVATFLFAFPFVLSGLNLAVPRNAIGYGFSGINMALFGYVAVALVTVLGDRFGVNARGYLPAVFLASVAYLAAHALPVSVASIGFVLAALVAASLYARSAERDSLLPLRQTIAQAIDTPVYGELLTGATIVLLGYPFVGFPAPTPGGPRINIYIHFLGYALAYIVVYVSLLVDRSERLWKPITVPR